MNKRFVCAGLAMVMCLSLCTSAFATDSLGEAVFSTIPTEENLRLKDRCQENNPVEAWIIDDTGNKTYIDPIDMTNSKNRSFIDGRIEWTFLRYEESVTKSNKYQHFVSSVSLRNNGTEPVPLRYTQREEVENRWEVTGKIDVEPNFKIAILAALEATFGLNVTDAHTTKASTEVEFNLTIPVGKTGEISKYYAGKYTGGQGVWQGTDIFNGGSIGYLYYEEATAWAIAKNEVNYDWSVT